VTTQLALRYVEDHGNEYEPIFWIGARSPETMQSSFERCAGTLLLPMDMGSRRGVALKDSPAVKSVLRWLGAVLPPMSWTRVLHTLMIFVAFGVSLWVQLPPCRRASLQLASIGMRVVRWCRLLD
jgi:hypothetical protein